MENGVIKADQIGEKIFDIGKGASNRTKAQLTAFSDKYPGSYLKCFNMGMEFYDKKQYGTSSFYFHKAAYIIQNHLQSRKIWPIENMSKEEMPQYLHEFERLGKSYMFLATCLNQIPVLELAAHYFLRSGDLYSLIAETHYSEAIRAYANFAYNIPNQWKDDTPIKPLIQYIEYLEEIAPKALIPANYIGGGNIPPIPYYPGYGRLMIALFYKNLGNPGETHRNLEQANNWFQTYKSEFARDPIAQLMATQWLALTYALQNNPQATQDRTKELNQIWSRIQSEIDKKQYPTLGPETQATIDIIIAISGNLTNIARDLLVEHKSILKPLDYQILYNAI